MSADTVDDLHAAEDAAGALARSGRVVLDAWESGDLAGAVQGLAVHVEAWEQYCRPTCRWRSEGECRDDPGSCGCPCGHGGRG